MSYEQEIKPRYLSQGESENKSNKYALWTGVFVVAHIIFAIIYISSNDYYGPAGASLSVLLVGWILSYFLVKKYSPSKISDDTKKLAEKLQGFNDIIK